MNQFQDIQIGLACDDYTMLCLISNWLLSNNPDLLQEMLDNFQEDINNQALENEVLERGSFN